MTDKEFNEICHLQQTAPTIMISYLDFQVTGKLVGCWEENLLVEINGQREVWPRELCEWEKEASKVPSYS